MKERLEMDIKTEKRTNEIAMVPPAIWYLGKCKV